MPRVPRTALLRALSVSAAALVLAFAVPAVARVLGASAEAVAQEDGATSGAVRVVGLSVAKPKSGDRFGGSRAFGLMSGTSVHLEFSRTGVAFLSVEKDESTLTTFADDLGTNLAQAKKGDVADWLWPFLQVADDGRSCSFQVKSEGVPAAGAKEVRVVASVGIRVGAEERTAEVKGFAPVAGATVNAGYATWTVKEVSARGKKTTITFHATTPFEPVRAIELTDAAGAAVPAELGGGGGFSMNGKGEWTKELVVPRVPEGGTLRVRYWGRTEILRVPVDLRVGVGF